MASRAWAVSLIGLSAVVRMVRWSEEQRERQVPDDALVAARDVEAGHEVVAVPDPDAEPRPLPQERHPGEDHPRMVVARGQARLDVDAGERVAVAGVAERQRPGVQGDTPAQREGDRR